MLACCSKFEKPLQILIVEDDTVSSIDLECILEDLGHQVAAVAVSPVFAAKALKTRHVDAVIFGATLVGLPPYALAKSLELQGLPAAVTSSHSEEFARVLGFKAPFLRKPYQHEDVAKVLDGFRSREVATAA